jgi:hypothetical protein
MQFGGIGADARNGPETVGCLAIARLSNKCPTNVTPKNVLQECSRRVSLSIVFAFGPVGFIKFQFHPRTGFEPPVQSFFLAAKVVTLHISSKSFILLNKLIPEPSIHDIRLIDAVTNSGLRSGNAHFQYTHGRLVQESVKNTETSGKTPGIFWCPDCQAAC